MNTQTTTNNISDKFSNHYKRSMARAIIISAQNKKKLVTPEDIFWSLLQEKGSLASEVLNKVGVKISDKKNEVKTSKLEPSQLGLEDISVFDDLTKIIIQESAMIANKNKHKYIGTEHLLMAIFLKASTKIDEIFTQLEISKTEVENMIIYLKNILESTSRFPELTDALSVIKQEMGEELAEENDLKNNKKRQNSKIQALNLFATNLTDAKVQERIDPVIGRETEINRIIQILARRTKNNPVLLGDAGVGKTAIAEGLAKRILEARVPDILLNKKIFLLDITQLVAGTMFRGDFENRIQHVLDEVRSNRDVILFIDEIHNIIGAGSGQGTMDIANILKPFLSRGEIRCIGATTFDEYKKYIERDPALDRRFQPVHVGEPSEKESIEILKGLKHNYEKHHLVKITDDAIEAAVKLSSRFMTDRFLPDKAIDLIDETASRLRVDSDKDPNLQKIKSLENQLIKLNDKKTELVKKEKFDEALEIKKQSLETEDQISKLQNKLAAKSKDFFGTISKKEVAEVVSNIVKIPIGELVTEEKNKLIDLEKDLNRQIIGQAEVIKELASSIKRSRAGLSGKKRPLGSFVFLGPSGVGKTETAKVLAAEVFGSADNLIRFDMSEFGESFNTTKLIGAPAGYVGYQEGGKLTEIIRRRPYSVVLFDEIEKAHPDIFNLLLQILEDGHLTDGAGKKINFRNTIILMTSNIGLSEFNEQATLGFEAEVKSDKNKSQTLSKQYEQVKTNAISGLKQIFRPELLNRVDKILVFKPLDKKSIAKVVELSLKELAANLSDQSINLKWDKKVIDHLTEESFSPDQGARLIRKIIQDKLEGQLADKILSGCFKEGSLVKILVKDKNIIVTE